MNGKDLGMEKTASPFKKNCALLQERFPELFFLLHSLPEKQKEVRESEAQIAQWQKSYSWENAEALYVYGLGDSYAALEFWLKQGSRDLIYLEDDPAALMGFLHTDSATDVLQNPKVHLYFFSRKEKEGLSLKLADAFPVKKVEIVPAPHRMGKDRSFFSSLRLEILRKTTLTEALILERIHSYIPFSNTVKNVFRMPFSFFIDEWKGKFEGVPAILCGAGPSLKKSLQAIRECENKALVMAGGSAITALTSQSILPHLGVMVDPNLEEYHRLKSSFGFEIPMIYHLRTKPDVFDTCSGPLGYMRSAIASLADAWIEEDLGLKGVFLGEDLSTEALSVTSLSLALAVYLGCSPIFLCGVDLAYTKGARYAEGVVASASIDLKQKDSEKLVDERVIRKIQNGKRVQTHVKWVMESAVLSSFAKKHPQKEFFNAGQDGLSIEGIPYRNLQEASQGFAQRDLRGEIFSSIQGSKTQITKEDVLSTLRKMAESIQRCKINLQTIVKGTGSKVLAQFELEEELAYRVLFYDLPHVLSKYVDRKFRDASPQEKEYQKWHAFEAIVYEYGQLLRSVGL
jgi:hypothetical protein